MNARLTWAGTAVVLAVAALAGCDRPASSGTGTPIAGPSTTASGQPGQGEPTTSTGGTPTAAGSTECRINQLDVSITGGDAGVGHRSTVIVFRNTGSATCVLQGYPGVAALDGSGHQVAQAKRTLNGYLGGLRAGNPPVVRLDAGASASAMVESVAFGADGASCTAYAGVLVTPPDETHSVRLSWGSDGCNDLQIHPVVSGTTGRSG